MPQTEGKSNLEISGKSAKNCGKIRVVKMRIPMGAVSRRKNFEIVFLPYKASMWDSLESIYLAAKNDPSCEAYVVPIPYFDRLPDGSFGEMRYEGNEYPDNIPITNYKNYNIEERRPDAIFIHNPYDNFNSVVSVDPRFYCEKLSRYTKMLCYVPYFVVSGKEIPEHFILTAASHYAHKTILQSEEVRETYIETLKKQYSGDLEDKFVALGSPKFDKVINTKKEDCPISDEWRELVGDKKVVLYNTTVTTILKDGEKNLQKLRSVFATFKEREDVVLWWRPHPLSETTYSSMRPELLEEYKEIVEGYRREAWGIFDDSADLHRAIAWGDVYYGDGSSVATLFEATKKPIVVQRVSVSAELTGLFDDGASLWFVDYHNVLYKYNKQNGETECVGIVPALNRWAYMGILSKNDKFYFAPYYKNDKISVLNIAQKKFEQLEFKGDNKYDKKFSGAVSYKNFVCFVPRDFPAIMRLNTDTNEIEYFSDWMSEVCELQTPELQYETRKDIKLFGLCVVGAEIVFVIYRANALMFFNMETAAYEIKILGGQNEQYHTVCFDGQNYYLTSCYENYIVKWNRSPNEYLKIEIPRFSRRENEYVSFHIRYLDGYIWLLPYAANRGYKINPSTNEITELPELTEHFEDQDLDWYYNRIAVRGKMVYAVTQKKGIVEFHRDTSELNFINLPDSIDSEILALLNYENKLESDTQTISSGKRILEYLKEMR